MGGNQREGVVVLVLVRQGIAVFPVKVHEDGLDNDSPVRVVEGLQHIAAASHSNQFFPLDKIYPLVLKQVLHGTAVVPNSLVIDVFIVNIGGSGGPGGEF